MTSLKGGVGGVSQKLILGDMGVVVVTKVPKMGDVIYEWSLICNVIFNVIFLNL